MPAPEIDCTAERITARFARSAEPRLREEHLNVTEDSFTDNCDFTTSEDAAFVSIAIPFTQCGTVREVSHCQNKKSRIQANFQRQ